MANPKLVTAFKTSLEDRPGALLAFANEMKSKNIGLIALWGYATQQGRGELYCIAKDAEKFRKAYVPAGMPIEEHKGFFLKGADRTGALVKTLEKIAQKGVNLVAVQALAAGGNYGSFLLVAPEDLERTAEVLGAKK
jgi:hypothetical protein